MTLLREELLVQYCHIRYYEVWDLGSVVLMVVALVLAPVLAGGMGELANGFVQVPVMLAAAGLVFEINRPKVKSITLPAGSLILLAFLALAAITSLFTECAYNSIKQWMFWFTCIAAFLVCAQSFTDKKKAMLPVVVLSLVATAICLMTIRDQAILSGGGSDFWKAVSSGAEIRVFGTFINPNFFGGFLIIAIPATIALFISSDGLIGNLIFGVSAIIQMFTLALTSSKFSTLALVAALVVFIVPVAIKKLLTKREWVKLALLTVVILAVLVPSTASLRTRVSESSAGGTQVHSTAFRIYTWKATAKMIASKPLSGVGQGNYDIAFPRYAIAALTKHAHQSFLQIGAEGGVFTLLAFIAGLIGVALGCVKALFKTQREAGKELVGEVVRLDAWPVIGWAIVGGLVGSAARNLVDSDWFLLGTSIPFWVMAGTLAAVTGSGGKSFKLNSIHSWSVYVLSALCLVFSIQFAAGDYRANVDTASDRFEAAVKVSPWNPVFHRAYALNGASSSEDALDAASRAVSLAPKDGANYFCRGLIYLTRREPEKAIPELEKSLELNPHSTQVMKMLSDIYQQMGNETATEAVLNKMLAQEDSPYETIKGIPELVDTNYSFAHAYFGRKLLAQGKYAEAVESFKQAADRLERWRKGGQYLDIARASGTLSKEEEQKKLELLRECYDDMAACYTKLGKALEAADAKLHASGVK